MRLKAACATEGWSAQFASPVQRRVTSTDSNTSTTGTRSPPLTGQRSGAGIGSQSIRPGSHRTGDVRCQIGRNRYRRWMRAGVENPRCHKAADSDNERKNHEEEADFRRDIARCSRSPRPNFACAVLRSEAMVGDLAVDDRVGDCFGDSTAGRWTIRATVATETDDCSGYKPCPVVALILLTSFERMTKLGHHEHALFRARTNE